MNDDGSRGKNLGNIVNVTNKDKETPNFGIGCRISEEDIVDHMFTVYFQNKILLISKHRH